MRTPEIDSEVERLASRLLLDVLNEATAAYWERRADGFANVGTPDCDDIARACRNRAELARMGSDEAEWSELLGAELGGER